MYNKKVDVQGVRLMRTDTRGQVAQQVEGGGESSRQGGVANALVSEVGGETLRSGSGQGRKRDRPNILRKNRDPAPAISMKGSGEPPAKEARLSSSGSSDTGSNGSKEGFFPTGGHVQPQGVSKGVVEKKLELEVVEENLKRCTEEFFAINEGGFALEINVSKAPREAVEDAVQLIRQVREKVETLAFSPDRKNYFGHIFDLNLVAIGLNKVDELLTCSHSETSAQTRLREGLLHGGYVLFVGWLTSRLELVSSEMVGKLYNLRNLVGDLSGIKGAPPLEKDPLFSPIAKVRDLANECKGIQQNLEACIGAPKGTR